MKRKDLDCPKLVESWQNDRMSQFFHFEKEHNLVIKRTLTNQCLILIMFLIIWKIVNWVTNYSWWPWHQDHVKLMKCFRVISRTLKTVVKLQGWKLLANQFLSYHLLICKYSAKKSFSIPFLTDCRSPQPSSW